MTDAFLTARPEYRRAMSKAARPMPLAFGEVVELRKPVSFTGAVVRCIPAFAALVVCIAGVCGLIVAVAG